MTLFNELVTYRYVLFFPKANKQSAVGASKTPPDWKSPPGRQLNERCKVFLNDGQIYDSLQKLTFAPAVQLTPSSNDGSDLTTTSVRVTMGVCLEGYIL